MSDNFEKASDKDVDALEEYNDDVDTLEHDGFNKVQTEFPADNINKKNGS